MKIIPTFRPNSHRALRGQFALTAALLVLAALAATPVFARDLTAEVDKLFRWVAPDAPGCVVAVEQDGLIVVSRAYGLADLERGIPLTTDSVFDIGSLQKQFVAAAILLLVEDGRIALTDDVREYFPELPDYGHRITVDHLLTHTSGLRDWVALLRMSDDDETALTAILRQRGLNFAPGEEWSYSNSGYVLLKELVARATGMSFAEFAHQRLFAPLGMTATSYVPDAGQGGKNVALAYEKGRDGWKQAMMLGNERGGGALLSTTGDLLLWNRALANASLGAFVTGKLQEPARLNNGRKLNYARGLFVDNDYGIEFVYHTGGAAGYKAVLGRLPQHDLSVAILSNAGDSEEREESGRRLIDLFLPAEVLAESDRESSAAAADAADPAKKADLSDRTGLFFNEENGDHLQLTDRGGRLQVAGGPPLTALGDGRFRNPEGRLTFRSQDAFELRFLSADELELKSMEGVVTRYHRARPWAPTEAELAACAGRYTSDELRAVIEVSLGDAGLVASLNDSPTFPFTPVTRDILKFRQLTLRFVRDAGGNVTTLAYSNPVLRNVTFTRSSGDAGGSATPPAPGR